MQARLSPSPLCQPRRKRRSPISRSSPAESFALPSLPSCPPPRSRCLTHRRQDAKNPTDYSLRLCAFARDLENVKPTSPQRHRGTEKSTSLCLGASVVLSFGRSYLSSCYSCHFVRPHEFVFDPSPRALRLCVRCSFNSSQKNKIRTDSATAAMRRAFLCVSVPLWFILLGASIFPHRRIRAAGP